VRHRFKHDGEWRLADPLAVPAGELLPHRLDHLPPPRDHLQRLGDILSELHDPARAATGAGLGCRDNHPLPRQVCRERLADRPAALGGRRRCGRWCRHSLGGQLVLGRCRLELLQLQLELLEEPRLPLRLGAVECPPQLLDLELQRDDHRVAAGEHRTGPGGVRLRRRGAGFRRRQGGTQRFGLGGRRRHAPRLPRLPRV
jgi:hypothetical protein